MIPSTNRIATCTPAIGLALLAGCAQPAPAPAPVRHDAATSGPEVAGAWYQVYFDTGSATVNDRGRMIGSSVARVMASNPTARLTVIGRSDRMGAAPDNLALSRRRANAVRDMLMANGVAGDKIDTSWTGEARAGAPPADDSVDPRNRAVDVTVILPPA